MIVSFSTLADWSVRHRINMKSVAYVVTYGTCPIMVDAAISKIVMITIAVTCNAGLLNLR